MSQAAKRIAFARVRAHAIERQASGIGPQTGACPRRSWDATVSVSVLPVARASGGVFVTPRGGLIAGGPYSLILFSLKGMAAASASLPAIFSTSASSFPETLVGLRAGPLTVDRALVAQPFADAPRGPLLAELLCFFLEAIILRCAECGALCRLWARLPGRKSVVVEAFLGLHCQRVSSVPTTNTVAPVQAACPFSGRTRTGPAACLPVRMREPHALSQGCATGHALAHLHAAAVEHVRVGQWRSSHRCCALFSASSAGAGAGAGLIASLGEQVPEARRGPRCRAHAIRACR